MKKLFIAILITISLSIKADNLSGDLYIDPTQQLIKKSNLPYSIKEFIEKKLDLKLSDNEIFANIKVCACNCHNFNNVACPAYPDYIPLSLLIETNNDGSFKLNKDGTPKFKNENDKVNLSLRERNQILKATLCLKQLKQKYNNIELKEELQKLYQIFKKQNQTYAQMFEGKNSSTALLTKLSSVADIYRNKNNR